MNVMHHIRSLVQMIVILLAVLLSVSCSGRRTEVDRSDIIPEKVFTEIITDMYLADGILSVSSVHSWYNPADSIAAFTDIFENYGYTKEKFDQTFRFYFIKKPKKLVRIYDKALAALSEMESRNLQEFSEYQDQLNTLWKGRDFITSGTGDTMFDIDFFHLGTFKLSFTLTLHPDDQTVNPRFFGFITHKDSIATGRRSYLNSIEYIKDGVPRRYSTIIEIQSASMLHLRGWLLYDDNTHSMLKKNYIIEDITVVSDSAE